MNVPSRGEIASPKKTLNSCGNSTSPFCVPGCAFAVCVNDVCNIVETGGMRLILSGDGVVSVGPIVCNPVNVYALSLNCRPKAVSIGNAVWQTLHARPVCREKLGITIRAEYRASY